MRASQIIDFNNNRRNRKHTKSWKQNNSLMNDHRIKKERNKKLPRMQ